MSYQINIVVYLAIVNNNHSKTECNTYTTCCHFLAANGGNLLFKPITYKHNWNCIPINILVHKEGPLGMVDVTSNKYFLGPRHKISILLTYF